MNRYIHILFTAVLFLLFVTGCIKEDEKNETLYDNYPATIRNTKSIPYIEPDFIDIKLYPSNFDRAWGDDGDRVVVTFKINSGKKNDHKFGNDITLLNIQKLPVKELSDYSKETNFGNDIITGIQRKWITNDILNFELKFRAENTSNHKFSLLIQPEYAQTDKDTITLRLHHDTYEDITRDSGNKKMYQCFSLDRLSGHLQNKDSLTLRIETNALHGESNKFLTYKVTPVKSENLY